MKSVLISIQPKWCELIEENYTKEWQAEEQIKALQKHGLENFIDVTSAMFLGII